MASSRVRFVPDTRDVVVETTLPGHRYWALATRADKLDMHLADLILDNVAALLDETKPTDETKPRRDRAVAVGSLTRDQLWDLLTATGGFPTKEEISRQRKSAAARVRAAQNAEISARLLTGVQKSAVAQEFGVSASAVADVHCTLVQAGAIAADAPTEQLKADIERQLLSGSTAGCIVRDLRVSRYWVVAVRDSLIAEDRLVARTAGRPAKPATIQARAMMVGGFSVDAIIAETGLTRGAINTLRARMNAKGLLAAAA